MLSHQIENVISSFSLTKSEMKHLSRIQREESNMNRISSANKARFENQLPVDIFIPSVFPERKPVVSIDEDGGKSFLKIGDFFYCRGSLFTRDISSLWIWIYHWVRYSQ